MEANWIIIGAVVVLAIVLVIYLIRQNQKDKKNIEEFLNSEVSDFEEESEINNHK